MAAQSNQRMGQIEKSRLHEAALSVCGRRSRGQGRLLIVSSQASLRLWATQQKTFLGDLQALEGFLFRHHCHRRCDFHDPFRCAKSFCCLL